MNGKRHRRKGHESGGSEGTDNGLPITVVVDPTTTDSARQKIITEIEALENAKSDSRITVGHEVETKKNNYVIVREIMKGRMSRVFEVKRKKDAKILAMKAHFPTDTGKATILRHEAHIYHELSVLARNLQKDDIRFLNIHDYGECSNKQFLFLTLGGQSLASFLSDERVPNYQTALNLSFQMLNVIEQIHTLGFIHCRIRPNTFITGLKSRDRFTLFIINFSLARMANPTGTTASQAATAIPRNPPQIFDRYAPRCQHFGLPYHRRDDLESWFYICCDLFHPFFLPWSSEKRLKSQQMAELKEKLMKNELYHRYSVMPKPFQAFAGAINETDGKLPNYNFFKECLMEDAKIKNCSFYSPWEFIPVASLPPVPESQSQTRIEYEFNQCIKNPTTFNFGIEKSKTVLPTEELSQTSSDVQIVLPKPKTKKSLSLISSPDSKNTKKSSSKSSLNSKNAKKSSAKKSSNSKNTKKVENAKSKESNIVPMTDAVKNDDASTPPSTTSKSENTSTTSGTNESKPAENDTDDVKDGGDSIPPPPTTTTSEPKNASYCIYFDVKHVQNSTISATTKESQHSEKGKNESKPPPTSDGSSDDDDDENEEEFKLKSPPRLSEQKSSTGPILQTIPNKRPSTKEASKSSTSSGLTGTSSSGSTTSTGFGTTGTTTSGSGSTGSSSDTSKTSSGPSLSTTSTASNAVSGNFKKEPLPSTSSSSSNGTPKKDNSLRKKIVATTPASAVSPSSPQPSSPSIPVSSKKSSIRISACSTASLPDFAKANNSPPKNDSVYFNPSNPALNNNNSSNKNNNVQNGSTFPNLTSPNVRTFQAHKNDSVYFGVPTDAAATPANTSGYLKPQKRDGNESKECNDKNTIAPKSSAKNDSVYFAPK